MNYVRAIWYCLVALFWRFLLILTVPLAWIGCEYPTLYCGFNVLCYDEMSQKAWDGED